MAKSVYGYLDYDQNLTSSQLNIKQLKGKYLRGPGVLMFNSQLSLQIDYLEKLKTPFQRRQELRLAKSAMDGIKTLSQELGFNKKRYRVLKNEYRNGILGIDDPISSKSDLYQDKYQTMQASDEKHREHLVKRQRNLAKYYGVSEQIEFATNDMTKRQDKLHHEISPFWSRKKRVAH